MFKCIAAIGLWFVLASGAWPQTLPPVASTDSKPPPEQPSRTKELLTDATIVAILIAASVAAYKATGRPCACPFGRMRNGRLCGNNSAWAKPGGYRPLCFPADVTGAMIQAYRAAKAIAPIR